MEQYSGSQIVVLEGLEAVRRRPGMYIEVLVLEDFIILFGRLLNGIDEHLAGFCNQIDVTIRKDGAIEITDNGRGIPVDIHPVKKIPTVRVIYTVPMQEANSKQCI